ncbi:MAG: Transcriptional regulator [Bacteroidetes bacterium]|nr:Transcriptional regulator [Bacteroidota bacterium]
MSEQQKFLKAVGRNVDKKRKEQGLSFQELALRCEIEKSNLVKLTSQGTNITLASLYKISKGLDVPVHELLKY